jgi:hypothetical protein
MTRGSVVTTEARQTGLQQIFDQRIERVCHFAAIYVARDPVSIWRKPMNIPKEKGKHLPFPDTYAKDSLTFSFTQPSI